MFSPDSFAVVIFMVSIVRVGSLFWIFLLFFFPQISVSIQCEIVVLEEYFLRYKVLLKGIGDWARRALMAVQDEGARLAGCSEAGDTRCSISLFPQSFGVVCETGLFRRLINFLLSPALTCSQASLPAGAASSAGPGGVPGQRDSAFPSLPFPAVLRTPSPQPGASPPRGHGGTHRDGLRLGRSREW